MTSNGNKSILVVDDAEVLRNELCYLLEDEGYSVKSANTGKKAIAQFQSTSFDLLITDILMPDMDGIELSRYVQTHYPETKIIAISGGGNLAASGIDILQVYNKVIQPRATFKKPFTTNDLLQKISEIIS
jgi:two-component system, cell cycle response regulator CpdR